jgi:lipopolysaccharide/colanic/teichoic acid biosynthesis glycosyltransferase
MQSTVLPATTIQPPFDTADQPVTAGAGIAWMNAPVRRTIDMCVAAGALVMLSPLELLIGLLVRLTSAGPALYSSPRIGRGGRGFRMFKFRTMVVDADQRGSLVTGARDPRVTRFGRWLRQTKLDELPSLWNVLIGDMALVGPRPENPRSVGLYTRRQHDVLLVRPGLTSLASIKYRQEEDVLGSGPGMAERYLEIMQDKLGLDLAYLQTASPAADLRIVLRTVGAVLGRGAAHA